MEFESTTEAFFSNGEPSRIYSILIPILSLIIIILNAIVLYSSGLLVDVRQHPRSCYMFLGNLGLSNLSMGVTVIFGHYYPSRTDTSCAFQIGMIVSSSLVSVYSVLLVAIDRFLYILRGLQYQQYMFPNRVRLLTAISWCISCCVGLLPLFPSLRGRMNANQCWFILLEPELVLVSTLIGTIPILIVFILYGMILYKALKKVNELKKASQGVEAENNLRFFRGNHDVIQSLENETGSLSNQPSKLTNLFCCWEAKSSHKIEEIRRKPPSRWKAVKVVMLTTGSFLITWVPYFIVSTMYVYCDKQNTPEYCYRLKLAIAGPLAIIGFSNGIFTPLIYCWWHNGFRKNSIRLLSRKFEKFSVCKRFLKSNSIDSPSTSNRPTTQISNLANTSIISSSHQEPML